MITSTCTCGAWNALSTAFHLFRFEISIPFHHNQVLGERTHLSKKDAKNSVQFSPPPSAMLKVQQQPQGGQYKALQIFVVALCVPTSWDNKNPQLHRCVTKTPRYAATHRADSARKRSSRGLGNEDVCDSCSSFRMEKNKSKLSSTKSLNS